MTLTTHPFAAIILAAGKGTRMKSDTHKVLHQIAGRSMLEHLMASVAQLGPERTAVVVGAGREQIEVALGTRAAICLQEPQLGTGHAVQQAEGALQGFAGDVLVLYGDVPFVKASTMRAMLERLHGADAPAAVVLGFEPADPIAYGRVIADDAGRVLKMVEYKDADEGERACHLCNSGLLAARDEDLFALLARVGNDNAQGEYYLPDIVNIAIADGRTCAVITADSPDEVAGINSRAELAGAEACWQAVRRLRAMDDGATLIAPETVFFSWDTQVGRDVTIEPNVFFGPGVSIADKVLVRANSHIEGASLASGVKVGPFARLRPGTVMEADSFVGNFVEVKNTVMHAGAKASHLTYLGDATIGAGANIGADAIVAAGSTVSRDVAPGELRMVRAEQLVKDGWADRFHDAMKKKKAAEKAKR